MIKLIKCVSIFTLVIFVTGCKGNGQGNCDKWYVEANSSLNDYYLDNDEANLKLSMAIIEKGYNLCPDFESRFVDLKITLLLLMKEYERGYSFIDSLEESSFEPSYKKVLYLKTFKALSLEKKGDIAGRDGHFEELVGEIEDYISSNPSSEEAIADLFYTKLRFEEKEKVIREIELMQSSSHIDDKEFLNALKESIKAAPTM